MGPYLDIKNVRAKSGSKRFQNGGAATALLSVALEEELVDAALVMGMDRWAQKAYPRVIYDAKDLEKCAGSKYTSNAILEHIMDLLKNVNHIARWARPAPSKRWGDMAGKQVIPPEEMVAKIKAALDARSDPDLIINAEAGADLIFVEAPISIEQMRRITRGVKAPNMVNMIPGGRTPLLTARELQDIGYSVVSYATACTYTIARAVEDLFEELIRTGTTAGFEDRMMRFDEFNRRVGLEGIREKEAAYTKDHP